MDVCHRLFRSAKNYPVTALLRGLDVEVEGRSDNSGALVAEKIKFTNDDFGVARSLESRVAPVETRVTATEGRMDTAENRITAAEQNAQRLSGQLEELVRRRQHGAWRGQSRPGDRRPGASRRQGRQIHATGAEASGDYQAVEMAPTTAEFSLS